MNEAPEPTAVTVIVVDGKFGTYRLGIYDTGGWFETDECVKKEKGERASRKKKTQGRHPILITPVSHICTYSKHVRIPRVSLTSHPKTSAQSGVHSSQLVQHCRLAAARSMLDIGQSRA